MSKYDQDILAMVALHGTVSVGDIAHSLNVTDQTVRRIVQPLVAQGRIRKVHGAIVSVDGPNDPPLPARLVENRAAKAHIAEMVAQIIPDGASLAIDTGSTSGIIAQALRQRRNLTVVSNSSVIAATLAVIPGNR
ncbi:MAG: DeoR/GlpR family DNA-binding transcription regulator, partial [Pseudomonadota bacterium]|nr:DeoR/GlpR family DNA-binding transcription regulator [Pseudomonadota bacterium]